METDVPTPYLAGSMLVGGLGRSVSRDKHGRLTSKHVNLPNEKWRFASEKCTVVIISQANIESDITKRLRTDSSYQQHSVGLIWSKR